MPVVNQATSPDLTSTPCISNKANIYQLTWQTEGMAETVYNSSSCLVTSHRYTLHGLSLIYMLRCPLQSPCTLTGVPSRAETSIRVNDSGSGLVINRIQYRESFTRKMTLWGEFQAWLRLQHPSIDASSLCPGIEKQGDMARHWTAKY